MKATIKRPLRKAYRQLAAAVLSLGSGRECTVCGWTGRAFLRRTYPDKPADIRLCPACGASERHRFAFLTLGTRLAAQAANTLHVAPEQSIAPRLRAISASYLSTDLDSPTAMAHMDLTRLDLPDEQFTLIWCSHVLEHVEEDRKAMEELFRVLRPDGLAVVMVPVYGGTTYEDPSIRSPEERLKHFKQEDHVRLYGLDITQRLESVGFHVEVIRTGDVEAEQVERYGLEYPSTQEIFCCTKP